MPRRSSLRWALLLAVGGVLGWGLAFLVAPLLTSEYEGPAPTPVTVIRTYIPQGTPGHLLRADVEETRSALLAAAEAGDYEALRPLLPKSGFVYTFGGSVEGGPIAYWQELDRTTAQRPLETLAAILRMPYTLGPLARLFVEGTGYLGWRAGIEPDGTWAFFVAGD